MGERPNTELDIQNVLPLYLYISHFGTASIDHVVETLPTAFTVRTLPRSSTDL